MAEKRTLDQERAADAWDIVQKRLADNDKKINGDYVAYVTGLPATILTNGLGQTAAMLLQSAGRKSNQSAHYLLYKDMEKWLCRKHKFAPYANQNDLMEAIVKGSRQDYTKAQMEVLAWLNWLKKFAIAFLKDVKADV